MAGASGLENAREQALTTEQVLREEAKAVFGDRAKAIESASGIDLYRELNNLNSAALCLSGGGIRSAAFALGVIQALATHPRPLGKNGSVQKNRPVGSEQDSLLSKFNYLSTVSGGGYIGSWLSAWLARRNLAGHSGWRPVWEALVGKRHHPDREAPELSWLRRYSNFLTPKLGMMSADSWAAIALVLRNLLLNWLIILPVLCALLLVCDLLAIVFVWVAQLDPRGNAARGVFFGLAGVGFLAQIYALSFSAGHRPALRRENTVDQTRFLYHVLLPLSGGALLLAFALATSYAQTLASGFVGAAQWNVWRFYGVFAGSGAIFYAAGWLIGRPLRQYARDSIGDFIGSTAGGAVFGAMIGLGVYLFSTYVAGRGVWIFKPSEVLLLVGAVPWILISHLIGEMIYVGLTSGLPDSDSDREWLGRSAGWMLAVAFGWLALTFLVFLGARLTTEIFDKYWPWLTGGGLSAGGVAAWLAKSRLSPATGGAKTKTQLSINVVLAIAAPAFAVILLVLVSATLDKLLIDKPLVDSDLFRGIVPADGSLPGWPGGWRLPAALVCALAIAAIASYYININRFSLHALYRNRLIRAFLGASNSTRQPNLFTGFDESDNLRVYDLWPTEVKSNQWPVITSASWRPFHIVNVALNAVSTSNLAWQERKAEPFTVSALHSGSSCVGFRYSTTYGDHKGISLGTAMAISGAAASPNMGYHSSPGLAFLMTLFNVRLGWWLGNPGPHGSRTYNLEAPACAIVPLLYEMFGQTTDDWKYIYLSDGGHFENLGLYEAVRRRCRVIVVSDAGCDPNFVLEDLGNAVRKIAIDLGIKISFEGLENLKKRPDENRRLESNDPYAAVGTIHYAAADGAGADGHLLYVKAGYHGFESAGIQSYAFANPDFPHETTGDQFFSESQFESYRSLGFEIVDGVLSDALTRLDGQPPSMENLIAKIGMEI